MITGGGRVKEVISKCVEAPLGSGVHSLSLFKQCRRMT